jgi:hypothetical protein
MGPGRIHFDAVVEGLFLELEFGDFRGGIPFVDPGGMHFEDPMLPRIQHGEVVWIQVDGQRDGPGPMEGTGKGGWNRLRAILRGDRQEG